MDPSCRRRKPPLPMVSQSRIRRMHLGMPWIRMFCVFFSPLFPPRHYPRSLIAQHYPRSLIAQRRGPLCSPFTPSSTIRRHASANSGRSFSSLKHGSSLVDDYNKQFRTLCDQLAAVGRSVPNEDKGHWLFIGLGPQFVAISNARMLLDPIPSLRDLMQQARNFEHLNGNPKSDSSTALVLAFTANLLQPSSGNNHPPQGSGQFCNTNSGAGGGQSHGSGYNGVKGKCPPRC